MAEEGKKEEAAPAKPAKAPMFTMPVLIVIVGVMLITAGSTYFVQSMFSNQKLKPPSFHKKYREVTFGIFKRELPADDLGRHRESFSVDVALVLNPNYEDGDLDKLASNIEKTKGYLYDIVTREILYKKTPEEFRKPSFLEDFALEIRDRINQEFGFEEEGQAVILRVIYPSSVTLPSPR